MACKLHLVVVQNCIDAYLTKIIKLILICTCINVSDQVCLADVDNGTQTEARCIDLTDHYYQTVSDGCDSCCMRYYNYIYDNILMNNGCKNVDMESVDNLPDESRDQQCIHCTDSLAADC